VIADDHPSFRASARAILEADGFEVVGEAEDGAGAIAAARRHRPDVLLLDVQLPDIDGFGVIEHVVGGNGGPLVVLISTRDAADYGTRVARSGAAGFISKEALSPKSLADVVPRR